MSLSTRAVISGRSFEATPDSCSHFLPPAASPGDSGSAPVGRLLVHVFRQIPGAALLRPSVQQEGERGAVRTLHPQRLPPVLLLQPDGGVIQVSSNWVTQLQFVA